LRGRYAQVSASGSPFKHLSSAVWEPSSVRRKEEEMKALLAAMLVLGTAACGGSANEPAEPAATQEAKGGAKTEVVAELKEGSITLDKDEVPVGEVTFQLRNVGKVGHAFTVLRTDLPVDELPIDVQQLVDVTDPSMEIAGFEPVFDPGNHQTLTVPLKAGRYVLICNIGHYQRGERTTFTVV
jgi:uncharacterized cupredoxin-like copper-binding protein